MLIGTDFSIKFPALTFLDLDFYPELHPDFYSELYPDLYPEFNPCYRPALYPCVCPNFAPIFILNFITVISIEKYLLKKIVRKLVNFDFSTSNIKRKVIL